MASNPLFDRRGGGEQGVSGNNGSSMGRTVKPAFQGDDFFGIASALEMNPNMGVNDMMLVGRDKLMSGKQQANPGLVGWQHDMQRNLATDASAWVVRKEIRDLAGLLPDNPNDDTARLETVVTFTYQVEPVNQRADRSHRRDVAVQYKAPSVGDGTVIQFAKSTKELHYKASAATVSSAAIGYAQQVNSYSRIGISGDMGLAMEVGRGPDMLGVFTVMWLLQLDVAGGARVELGIDANDMRVLVPSSVSPLDEADAMKAVPGIRLHSDALDPLAYRLLYTATHRSALGAASPWVNRYRWPTTPLTVYSGALNPGPYMQAFNGRPAAAQLAGQIVNIANTYDLRDTCSRAYSIAFSLYGDRCVNRNFRLHCGRQTLFHEISNGQSKAQVPQMCWALGSYQLPMAAKFNGYANAEYMRDLCRSTITAGLRIRDRDAVRRAVDQIDVHALKTVQQRFEEGQQLTGALPIDYRHYVKHGIRRAWVVRGILHNLSLGRAVPAAISGSAVKQLRMPSEAELADTDVLAYGKERAESEANAWLINELIRNGGTSLCQSVDEAIPRSGATAVLHTDCRYYMGMDLQYKIVGFGNDMRIKYNRPLNFVYAPTPTMVTHQRDDQLREPSALPMTVVDKELADDKADDTVVTPEDILREVMQMRGTRTSTLFRGKPPTKAPPVRYHDGDVLTVTAARDDVRQSVVQLAQEGGGPGPTSGENLLCGAHAIQMALEFAGHPNHITVEQLEDELRTAVLDAPVDDDSELRSANNFTADQLGRAANRHGYNLTVVTGQGKGAAVAYSATELVGAPHLVVFNFGGNHWEGPVRQGKRHAIRVDGQDAGTPAVEAARARSQRGSVFEKTVNRRR
ncbi:hypothetical protein KM537_s3gp1 [Fusarium graminearum dsRNA mycovirus 2]|uniref:Uncharacterized protein n=1 Tax=Fusarium graminearum dsRNA mycovirus 2 TaxID=254946 RepID=G4WH32_9VIRU|nr:hypothetical protein KM537_s3gp1 [Fusarium graminearum dsRNA mycovirus 2]ADW08804.1 hypothetical protein [Fusarium graminearum dsRNA mycovirus 2]